MTNNAPVFGGPWTDRKLAILSKYLNAYSTALSSQPFEKLYIDAFAGTGYRENSPIQNRIGQKMIFR